MRCRLRQALVVVGRFGRAFQRVLRRDEPPDPIQLQALQGIERHHVVAMVGRVERAAKQADALALAEGRRLDHGRVCPVPRTWYLKVVSCSRPTGPTRMQLAGRNSYFGSETKFAAIGKLRRGIVQDDGAIDLGEEFFSRLCDRRR